MDKIVDMALQKVPMLLWPIFGLIFLYGLVLLIKNIYGFLLNCRKDYISELQEHLNFKEKRVEDYICYTTELKDQLERQETLSRINYEIAQTNYEIGMDINNEYNTFKQNANLALLGCMWMLERERFLRNVFTSILTNISIPDEINDFFGKQITNIMYFVEENDKLYSEIDCSEGDSFGEKVCSLLSAKYIDIPIKEEMDIFNTVSGEVSALVSIKQKPNKDE